MIIRFDRLGVALPEPSAPSPNAAAAVQELLGGKFGEMSTFMNYTFQSFNFRGREEYRPFYDLIANIAAEEFSHVELVTYTINMLLNGATPRDDDPVSAPLEEAANFRCSDHFLNTAQTARPMDSMGRFWTGEHVYNSGNLRLDLLHNFFLECGARAGKIRAYESTSDPCARAMIGFLLVRGGVHIVAYAKALQKLSGVDVGKLLPIPDISNKKFPEAKVHEDNGLHLRLYRFSPEDYGRIGEIWNGEHPEDGQELGVVEGTFETAVRPPNLPEEPQLTAPGVPDDEMLADFAKRLFGDARGGNGERDAIREPKSKSAQDVKERTATSNKGRSGGGQKRSSASKR